MNKKYILCLFFIVIVLCLMLHKLYTNNIEMKINNKIINQNDNPMVPSIYSYIEDCIFVVCKNKPSNNDKVIM